MISMRSFNVTRFRLVSHLLLIRISLRVFVVYAKWFQYLNLHTVNLEVFYKMPSEPVPIGAVLLTATQIFARLGLTHDLTIEAFKGNVHALQIIKING